MRRKIVEKKAKITNADLQVFMKISKFFSAFFHFLRINSSFGVANGYFRLSRPAVPLFRKRTFS